MSTFAKMLLAELVVYMMNNMVIISVVIVQILSFECGCELTGQKKGVGVFWV